MNVFTSLPCRLTKNDYIESCFMLLYSKALPYGYIHWPLYSVPLASTGLDSLFIQNCVNSAWYGFRPVGPY